MPNRGAQNYTLPINGSYNIPEGYHNGAGKVTQTISTANGTSVTPNTSVVTINTDKKYINGNYTIPAFTLPSASILKKGAIYTLYGKTVTGIFEGYVPMTGDLYYKGSNPGKIIFAMMFGQSGRGSATFDTAQITCIADNTEFRFLQPTSSYNLTPYKKLIISTRLEASNHDIFQGELWYGSNKNVTREEVIYGTVTNGNTVTYDISSINATKYFGIRILMNYSQAKCYVDRIYFTT